MNGPSWTLTSLAPVCSTVLKPVACKQKLFSGGFCAFPPSLGSIINHSAVVFISGFVKEAWPSIFTQTWASPIELQTSETNRGCLVFPLLFGVSLYTQLFQFLLYPSALIWHDTSGLLERFLTFFLSRRGIVNLGVYKCWLQVTVSHCLLQPKIWAQIKQSQIGDHVRTQFMNSTPVASTLVIRSSA